MSKITYILFGVLLAWIVLITLSGLAATIPPAGSNVSSDLSGYYKASQHITTVILMVAIFTFISYLKKGDRFLLLFNWLVFLVFAAALIDAVIYEVMNLFELISRKDYYYHQLVYFLSKGFLLVPAWIYFNFSQGSKATFKSRSLDAFRQDQSPPAAKSSWPE